MNTQLYNQLIRAKNFWVTATKNEYKIMSLKECIKLPGIDVDSWHLKHPPSPDIIETKIGLSFFLFFFALPLGLIYWGYIYFHNNRERKRYEKELNAYHNTPEYKEYEKKVDEHVIELKKELEQKITDYRKWFSDNYWDCVGFLPDEDRTYDTVEHMERHIEYIDGLIRYVKGGAKTLYDAMKEYGIELREIDAWEAERDRKERMERQHKQEMEKLNTIAKNQERIHDELKKINNRHGF